MLGNQSALAVKSVDGGYMKKIIKVFPLMVLIILTCLTVFVADMNERQRYKTILGYEEAGFTIPENAENITNDEIDQVFLVAKENHVVLMKTSYDKANDAVVNYVTTDNVCKLYGDQLGIEAGDLSHCLGISTYDDKDSYHHNDILDNDRYSFYPSSLMRDRKVYRYGPYMAFYRNEADYMRFLDGVSAVMGVSPDALHNEFLGQLAEPIGYFKTAYGMCFMFFCLFYFVQAVFLFYRDAKKIGILTMLGYSDGDILRVTLHGRVGSMIVASVIMIVASAVVVPNITLGIVASLIGTYLTVITMTVGISFLALLFMHKFFSVSNVLKKQSLVRKISDLCLICKFVMVTSMMVITIGCLPLLQETYGSIRKLKDNRILMDYAVFPRVRVDNEEYDDYDKFLAFYKQVQDNNVDSVYVNFGGYLETDPEVVANYQQFEETGTSFRMATVNEDYLSLYELRCYTQTGTVTDLNSFTQEVYLIPESKKEYTDGVVTYTEEKYKHYNISDPVVVYYYDDRSFDTFDSEKGVTKVDSPIFRVISENDPYTYFENSYGIDVAGTGMSTALKFKVSDTDDFYHDKLFACIKAAGLQSVLVEDNFVRYDDHYNDLIAKVQNTNILFLGSLTLCLCIYVYMILQTFVLFIEARKKDILVKSLLGFRRRDVFKKVIVWNVVATLLPVGCICAYSIASLAQGWFFRVAVCAVFAMIDVVLLLLITHTVKTDKVYAELKGE